MPKTLSLKVLIIIKKAFPFGKAFFVLAFFNYSRKVGRYYQSVTATLSKVGINRVAFFYNAFTNAVNSFCVLNVLSFAYHNCNAF
jgi:hypothetical protein